jgi:hypothetical protein
MVVKLELLSENLVIIVNKLLENPDLVKLVYYDDISPLSKPNLSASVLEEELFLKRIFPYPFNGFMNETQTQIRVFYPKVNINILEETRIYFEILTHNDLYLIKDNSNKTILRNYRIASEISRQFEKPVSGIGRLEFINAGIQPLPDNLQILRMEAKMLTMSRG